VLEEVSRRSQLPFGVGIAYPVVDGNLRSTAIEIRFPDMQGLYDRRGGLRMPDVAIGGAASVVPAIFPK